MLWTTRSQTHHSDGSVTYHITVNLVSRRDWLVAKLYHWYDMWIPIRVPGWKRFDRWLQDHGAEPVVFPLPGCMPKSRIRDRLADWTTAQDLRCYELMYGRRRALGTIEVSKEDYRVAGGTLRSPLGQSVTLEEE